MGNTPSVKGGGISMKVQELMSKPVIRIMADEPVAVAARTLAHYNIFSMKFYIPK